jgi:hypothetical protein
MVQVRPAGQILPHAPQLLESLCVSVQMGPHCVSGVGHIIGGKQAPLAQVQLGGQWRPHWPQLAGSFSVSVQTLPHVASGGGHMTGGVQNPMVHAKPAGQTLPHLPQLAGSACMSTQSLPHCESGGGHIIGGMQKPMAHVKLGGQSRPHAPQLAGSLCVSTQPEPHCARGGGQVLPPQTPWVQMPVQQSEPVMQGVLFGRHCAPLWQAPATQSMLQHSDALRHGWPGERHDGSFPKSTPTVASPARCISSRTMAICPGVTLASTGALTHVGADVAVTPEHGPANASPTKLTVPVGRPVTSNVVLVMGTTSKLRVTVKVPVAVTVMHPTLPSPGTCVIAI